MKTTRIDIEGPNGEATITRNGVVILVAGKKLTGIVVTKSGRTSDLSEHFTLRIHAGRGREVAKAAETLQMALDGCRGCAGDVAGYRIAIQMLAD